MAYRNIGELDRRISILTPTVTDGIGGDPEVTGWSVEATVWAKYEPQSGSEGVASDAKRAKHRAMFTIRNRSGMTAEKRIRFDGADWEIRSINDPGRKKQIEIVAECEDKSFGS